MSESNSASNASNPLDTSNISNVSAASSTLNAAPTSPATSATQSNGNIGSPSGTSARRVKDNNDNSNKQVSFSSSPKKGAGGSTPAFQVTLKQFYEWLIRWRRGLTERKVLEYELQNLVNGPHFTWCNALGQLYTGMEWQSSSPNGVYGSAASWLTLNVELQNVNLLKSNNTGDCHLIVAQVWETTCRDSVKDQSTTGKQITVWMKKEKSAQPQQQQQQQQQQEWTLLHLHETYIKGYEETSSTPEDSPETTTDIATLQQDEVAPLPPWDSSHSNPANSKINSIPSHRRHVATNLEDFKAKPLLWNGIHLVGISIAGWDIGTSQGPIGDAVWFQQALDELEPLAQYKLLPSRKRRLVLPEMVFPLAHVVLDYRKKKGDLFLSWDAMDALKDWSKCHQAIPMPDADDDRDKSVLDDDQEGDETVKQQETGEEGAATTSAMASTTPANRGSVAYRGVSVLQSSDATLWNQKDHASHGVSTSTFEFHYDWTFSTPFFGKFYGTRMSTLSVSSNKDANNTSTTSANTSSQRGGWKVTEESNMPMHLLTDQSVPILYFDHVILLEDDLHDNGLVQYSIKVRVMPTCAFVLSRLFVRVDNVLIRVRDCRLLVDFTSQNLYRDICWRECYWQDLPSRKLPTDVRAWKLHDTQETPSFQYMLQQLPILSEKELPKDIPPHAELSFGSGGISPAVAALNRSTASAPPTTKATAAATRQAMAPTRQGSQASF